MLNQLLKKKVKGCKSTQREIADAVGISRQQLWNYTDDDQTPNVAIANSLARYFGVETQGLFPYYNKPRGERYGA
jgi:DNA-binding XRE family transcriptional regulator